MFLYNRGYYSAIDGVNPHGVVMTSSSIQYEIISKRDVYSLPIVLFDPQYYLHGINSAKCTKTFNKLITYPWNEKIKDSKPVIKKISDATSNSACSMISSHSSEEEILGCIKACFDIQVKVGATDLIIPTPLAVAREDQFSEQLKWLKAANKLRSQYTQPFLATIALSDKTLLDCNFEDNQLVQTILDNAPVLPSIDGFYIVVERSSSSIQIAESNIAKVLLELSYNLGSVENKKVIVNFADVFGLLCLAAGATAFGSGYYTKERRLCLGDFVDKNGGMSLPTYYSSSLIGDFYSERDLKKIINLKLLRYLKNDIETIYSKPLIQSLSVKGEIEVPPTWAETRTNIAAATKHRVECLGEQATIVNGFKTIEKKFEYIQTWLQEAEARMAYLNGRLKHNPLSETGNHITVWRGIIDKFMEENL